MTSRRAALIAQAHDDGVTVNASLPSVAFYQRHGFACSGEVGESAGLIYQPMVRDMPHAVDVASALG